MDRDMLILIGFGVLLMIFIVYCYNKNSSDDVEDFEENKNSSDDVEDFEENKKNKQHKRKIHKDIFPHGRSFLINPNTGLNSYGCNCICHNGERIYHIAPCCGIKEVCRCPCHNGIDIDHNTKCCDSAVIN